MKVFLPILFMLVTSISFSQNEDINRCDFDAWLDEVEESNPGYKQQLSKSFENFKKNKTSSDRSMTITIPVHVIIVHPTGQPIGTGSNHSLAHVQSQIDVLNQDFGRYNSDAGNTPPEFPAADTGIQFCLATVDPNGNPTDGITRYAFDGAFHPNAYSIRQETAWPRDSYSNIWSAPNLPYLGLASVPSTFNAPPEDQDFIHVDAATFGGPGFATFPNYNLGRTTTHEMGHWLGLLHVWGNGGCVSDDGIDDTPIQDSENFGCPNHPSPSCGNSGDMFMNYMDYVNDNCMNAFTQDQGEYMNSILSTSRASLNGSSFTACATSVPLVLNIVSQEDPSCSDIDDGFILAEASGGSPDYTYSINGSTPTSNNLFTDLAGGNYTIDVFDADGNTASESVFLSTPLPLTANIMVVQENECPNEENGVIEVTASGGNNPYMYALNMGMTQSSGTFMGLSDGFYVVNITDENGCIYEEAFELSGSPAIDITIDSTGNLTCSNDNTGFIMASAEGGDGPLSFSINGFDFQENGDFLELDGGTYFVYVQDSLGCYDSTEVVLSEPDPFFLGVQAIDVTCFGFANGSVEVNAMGGNGGPYQYSFDSVNYSDATLLDSLSAGLYDLYALDSLGCMAFASFEIEEPDEVMVTLSSSTNVDCFGDNNGSANIEATGGDGNFTYVMEGDSTDSGAYTNLEAGVYEVYVFDSNGCDGSISFEIGVNSMISIQLDNLTMPTCNGDADGIIEVSAENTQGDVMYSIDLVTFQESPIFDGLSAGSYQVVVQDESGCNAAMNVDVNDPDVLEFYSETTNPVSCNGGSDGSVSFFVMGGVPPYQYMMNGEEFETENLVAGNYAVMIQDANGCTKMTDFIIEQPDPIDVNIMNQTDADCDTYSGASLELEAQGGNGGYIYDLSGTSGVFSNNDGDFGGLSYGLHQAVVRDEKGCAEELEIKMKLENGFYAELTSVENIDCFAGFGGSVNIDVEGGLGNISYLLDGAIEVDPSMLDTHAGEHSISIVDENDCTIELFFTLEEPEELIFDDITFDTENEIVTVIMAGGTAPYMYSYDEGVNFSNENTFNTMGPGEYPILVRDANGCESETVFIINNVNDLAQDWGVNAFPNPFLEELTLALDLPNEIEATIEVFDISGRLVHKISAKKYATGENFVKLNLRNFASSIYIVKIASAEGYRYIKATKM